MKYFSKNLITPISIYLSTYYYINIGIDERNAKCKMQNAKCKMQNAECRMQNAELRIAFRAPIRR